MSFWKRLSCFFLGHKTSLYPGIGAPAAFQWTYPGQGPVPIPVIVPAPATVPVQMNTFLGIAAGIRGPSRGGIGVHAVGGAGHGIVAHTGPAYNLDLCPRCLALYAAPPAPCCKHCHQEKGLHEKNCALPCGNCGKPVEAHLEGKCLFEASEFKGLSFEAV